MRHTKKIELGPEGRRDAGKTFLLTELPAHQGEDWAARAYGSMIRVGLDVPGKVILKGMAAIAAYGLRNLLAAPAEEWRPLMDEMMTCVKVIDRAVPEGRELTPDDIEEVSTLYRLREEVIELHTGFSLAAVLLGAVAEAIAEEEAIGKSQTASSNTQTSPPPSDESSPEEELPS